jgi:micrococcal nuclease
MYEYNATLLRVIDGDTIEVDLDLGFHVHYRSPVRMAGYDAPELRSDAGFKAKEYLYNLLKDRNRPLVIRTMVNKEFEKYGRVLGAVMYGSVNINEEMVKAGHVKPPQGGIS